MFRRYAVVLGALAGALLMGGGAAGQGSDAGDSELVGVWNGGYYCPPGPKNVSLEIWRDQEGALTGRFRFEPRMGAQGEAGAYLVTVRRVAGRVRLEPLGWERQPTGYRMVGASLEGGGGEMHGQIDDRACGDIHLARAQSANVVAENDTAPPPGEDAPPPPPREAETYRPPAPDPDAGPPPPPPPSSLSTGTPHPASTSQATGIPRLYALGYKYHHGVGVKKDLDKALGYFNQAYAEEDRTGDRSWHARLHAETDVIWDEKADEPGSVWNRLQSIPPAYDPCSPFHARPQGVVC